jgi:hypothetical protein
MADIVSSVLISSLLHQIPHYRQLIHLCCYVEGSPTIFVRLIHVRALLYQLLHYIPLTEMSCIYEWRFSHNPFTSKIRALLLVPRPIVSLT